jgi:protein-L-isoaspartate(D-aspartate) O-methyltransferase
MYESEKKSLVDTLRKKGIKSEKVLNAIENVERHLFIPAAIRLHAYKDNALPIGYEQTISQPYTVAFMTEALDLKNGDKILEIGTGSGYQAAILAYLGMRVFSVERNFELHNKAQKLFDELGIRAVLRCADGTLGWSEFAPYNAIIVTAGSPDLPKTLFQQLEIGGRLIIPIGQRKVQELRLFTKLSEEKYTVKTFPDFSFVPLIGREGWKE